MTKKINLFDFRFIESIIIGYISNQTIMEQKNTLTITLLIIVLILIIIWAWASRYFVFDETTNLPTLTGAQNQQQNIHPNTNP